MGGDWEDGEEVCVMHCSGHGQGGLCGCAYDDCARDQVTWPLVFTDRGVKVESRTETASRGDGR